MGGPWELFQNQNITPLPTGYTPDQPPHPLQPASYGPGLPDGFTLDPAPQPSGLGAALPAGFTLDEGPWTQYQRQAYTPPATSDLEALDSDEKVNGFLAGVPAEHVEAARNAWGDALAAKHVREGGAGMRASNIVSRVSRNVPGIGSYLDEANAAWQSALGGNYENALAYQRARDRLADQENTPKLLSTPIGDVYESGLEKAAGGVAGGLVMPTARIMPGSGFLPGAINTAANAGAYSAADAFGQGEGSDDRLNRIAADTPTAALVGAGLGGALGRFARRGDPAAVAAANATPQGQAVAAADRAGVELPKFLASDSNPVRSTAGFLASQPLTGGIVSDAAQNAANQTGAALQRAADAYSDAGTGATRGVADAAAASRVAGEGLSGDLQDWMGPQSKNDLSLMYGKVYSSIPATATIDLPRTSLLAQTLLNESDAATTPLGNQVVGLVGDAVTRPGGLTLKGAQDLRTYIGAKLNDSLLPEGGTIKPALKRIYGALSTDIENGLRQRGGNLLADWQAAEATARQFSDDREALAKIVGLDGGATGEQVVDRLTSMAGTRARADEQRLLLAKQRATPEVWNELASSVIRKLGEGPASNPGAPGMASGFSPDRFLTAWGKLSVNGKNAIFGSSAQGGLRQSLDDIATVAERFRDLRKFQNPSGTAHAVGGIELISEFALAGPIAPLVQVASAGAASWLLSRPASAKTVANWGNAAYRFTKSGQGAATVRFLTLQLAKQICGATGQDEGKVAQELAATVPPHLQAYRRAA